MAGTGFLLKSSFVDLSISQGNHDTSKEHRTFSQGHTAPAGNAAEIGRSLKEEPSDELTSGWCGGADHEASSEKAGSPATGFSLNN